MAHLCMAPCMNDYFLALDYSNSSSALGKMGSTGYTADKQEGTTAPASNRRSVPMPCLQHAGGAAFPVYRGNRHGRLRRVQASSCTGPCAHVHAPARLQVLLTCFCSAPRLSLPTPRPRRVWAGEGPAPACMGKSLRCDSSNSCWSCCCHIHSENMNFAAGASVS